MIIVLTLKEKNNFILNKKNYICKFTSSENIVKKKNLIGNVPLQIHEYNVQFYI